ncbi:MAG: SRPBCC domain-containing protein [Candidatus Woesearchaeota archaeon]|jgi:activator of HSP90 ATPase
MKTMIQTIIFDAAPHDIYEILMDSKKHSFLTGDKAVISRKEGGKIKAYGDYIEGKNLKLVQDKLIVQSWRASDWPKGHYSTITFKFKKDKKKTILIFSQEDIPEYFYSKIKQGWIDFYWNPLKYMTKQTKN